MKEALVSYVSTERARHLGKLNVIKEILYRRAMQLPFILAS